MHAAHNSTLLPDLFRPKTAKVRTLQPRVILLDFHGTISEKRWEDKVIFPYVKREIGQYLKTNWYNDSVQQCFLSLQNESFEQRFRNKFENAPVISEATQDGQEMESDKLITQVSDFLIWQIDNHRKTKDTQLIERLVWMDGLTNQKIKVPIYDDVIPSLQRWRSINKCAIYATSSIEERTLKLLFMNTDKGDLSNLIEDYACPKRCGEKITGDFYKRFYEETITSHQVQCEKNQKLESNVTKGAAVKADGSRLETSSDDSSRSSNGKNSISSDIINQPRPILYLTDSGKEAKAANQVADGLAYECILVCRPGNRQIRTYYLSHFSYIERFSDIEFVQTPKTNIHSGLVIH